jgi:hypothetical protein
MPRFRELQAGRGMYDQGGRHAPRAKRRGHGEAECFWRGDMSFFPEGSRKDAPSGWTVSEAMICTAEVVKAERAALQVSWLRFVDRTIERYRNSRCWL